MADTIYKKIRIEHNMSRDEVCDEALQYGFIAPERLERVENGKHPIHPDEVLLLSEIYGEPTLCNYYCSQECPIGQKYVPEIKVKDLSKIVLEMLASLNSAQKRQERLIEISADGVIDADEIKDFVFIQKELERISVTVECLQLWVEQMLAENKIDRATYEKFLNNDK
jgi:hypothetical protein